MRLDLEDIQPIVEAAVTATLGRIEADRAKTYGRLAFPEAEAASMLRYRAARPS